jgi:hypothetical protein
MEAQDRNQYISFRNSSAACIPPPTQVLRTVAQWTDLKSVVPTNYCIDPRANAPPRVNGIKITSPYICPSIISAGWVMIAASASHSIRIKILLLQNQCLIYKVLAQFRAYKGKWAFCTKTQFYTCRHSAHVYCRASKWFGSNLYNTELYMIQISPKLKFLPWCDFSTFCKYFKDSGVSSVISHELLMQTRSQRCVSESSWNGASARRNRVSVSWKTAELPLKAVSQLVALHDSWKSARMISRISRTANANATSNVCFGILVKWRICSSH